MDILRTILDRTGVDDLIALALVGVSAILWLSGQEIPDNLSQMTIIVVGFYFGKKYTESGITTGMQSVRPALAAPLIEEDEA